MAFGARRGYGPENETQWRVTQLRSALECWGRHHPWCEYSTEKPCNCGLASALDGLRIPCPQCGFDGLCQFGPLNVCIACGHSQRRPE